jgi:LmbE family N-acetylglucosaminyl deacetylase
MLERETEAPQVVPLVRDLPVVANPLLPGDRVLLVGAHPDDETIGAGRLVAGHPGDVVAVTLSAGERCVVSDRVDPVDLGVLRLAEWRAAVHVLGAEVAETPRFEDGRLGRHEAEIADGLAGLVSGYDVVLTTWRHDPHPDHRAVGRACATAAARTGARIVEYPVWAPYWMTPEETGALRYRLCAVETSTGSDEARREALLHYASQTQPILPGWEPVVPQRMLVRHDRQLLAIPADD